METWIALMRGINLGGRNKVPMPALRGFVEDAGGEHVRTYLQSGNVVFDAATEVAVTIGPIVTARIREELGSTSPVVLVSASELRGIAAHNPFVVAGEAESACHLMVLSEAPDPERVAALDPDQSPGDTFRVDGRAIYLHLPGGVARSKLTNDFFDRRLGIVSTSRNWRTVSALMELSEVER